MAVVKFTIWSGTDGMHMFKTGTHLGKHRIVNWPDSRVSDIRFFEKFNIRLSGQISGRRYPAG